MDERGTNMTDAGISHREAGGGGRYSPYTGHAAVQGVFFIFWVRLLESGLALTHR